MAFFVIELVLQECQFLRRDYAHSKSIFNVPATLHGNHSLIDVCCHIGMDMEGELLDSNLVDQLVNLIFQLVGKEY